MTDMDGVILKAISGFYYISSENGELYECKARGNFRNAGISPVVGDRVSIELSDGKHGVVDKIYERKSFLTRPLISNIDKLFIVSAFKTPSPDPLMIDRLSAIAVYHNIAPVIVFNKCDLGSFEKWEKIYKQVGFPTYTVSASNKSGIEGIRDEMRNCISAFTGNSGVGKSSILNSLFPDLNLKTGDVSEKLGRGRHTTRHTELFPHNYGGFVADTPGFSSLEENSATYDFKENLSNCFPEFQKFYGICKFSTCKHTGEAGCAILQAVKNGEVSESRFESYVKMMNDLKDIKEWQQSAGNSRK